MHLRVRPSSEPSSVPCKSRVLWGDTRSLTRWVTALLFRRFSNKLVPLIWPLWGGPSQWVIAAIFMESNS